VTGPDSKPVGILPWQGLFGWRGLLLIESREAVDLELLAQELHAHAELTNRISLALELQRSIAAAGSATEQSSRLVEFLGSAMHGISSQPAMTETLEQVAALMVSDSAAFWGVDAQTGILRMVAAHGLNPADFLPVPRGQGLSGWVAESRQPLAIEDAPADPKCLFPAEARESGIGSYLGVPVFDGDQVEGVLEVHTRRPQPWSPASVSALRSAAIAISPINRGVQPQPEQPRPEAGLKAETAYLGMSQTLEALGSKDEIIEAVVGVLGHALGVSRVIAIERGGQTGYLNAAVVKHEYHDPDAPSTLGAMIPEESAAQLFEGEGAQWPLVVNDSASGSPMPSETVTRLHICSELLLSLRMKEGVVALIDIQQCGQPREWTRDEVDFADKLAHQASVAITHIGALDKASRELEAARAEARRASDVATRARGIVDSVPEAIIGLDRDGRLTFFNAPGRVRYKLKNEDLGRMVGMVESLTLSDESIWEKVNSSHGIVRLEATIAAPRKAAPLAAPDRRSAQERSAISLPISIAVAPIRNEKEEITGRILVLTDLSHTRSHSKKDTGEHVAALEAKMKETEQALSDAHKVIEGAAVAEESGGEVGLVGGEIEKVRTDEARARRAAQQLLEINRLKSDFIVNAGRELDASLQSVLGFAELLGQGQYGQLAPDQLEAVKGIYAWARRMKNDVDWLVEYGSTRSRVLESPVDEAPEQE
jgi:GAF domain-containing protein